MPKAKRRNLRKGRRTFSWRATFRALAFIALGFSLPLAAYVVYLDRLVVRHFEGKRFALPARVYARPLELYPGSALSPARLLAALERSRYSESATLNAPGQYRQVPGGIEIALRAFQYWDGHQEAVRLRLGWQKSTLESLENLDTGGVATLVRVDPPVIGGIYPRQGEDRELVRLDEVPKHFVQALIATEDKRFLEHKGIDPKGIARAITTLFTRDRVQGGSTLTQQLVKNFFLTQERTVRRKLKEILMALLLERRYDKAEILETYLNEVYLGQDQNRAIHGVGLASRFYFDRDIGRLDPAQSALLVGMLKGPGVYNPRRHPERAVERRNLVLAEMARDGHLEADQLARWQAEQLVVRSAPKLGQTLYPAFVDLVIRQLKRDYDEADLRSEGLRIFSTLDLEVQSAAESALKRQLQALEKAQALVDGHLQGAVVVSDIATGEVSALVGGRDPRFEGFNRALDAQRQVGSLLKPAVYLAALMAREDLHLTSMLDDSPFRWEEPGIEPWEPQNYDQKFRGDVALWRALAHSYNVPAARLGTEIGVNRVMATVAKLGIESALPAHASSLLGTVNLSPLEVAAMYQTLASGGFQTPFRAIRDVTTREGQALNRYDLAVRPTVPEEKVYLINRAMQETVREGTAKGLRRWVPEDRQLAGKTGTTDELRDSWFAGFGGEHVAVVWVGNDDNASIKLTGATGALRVFGTLMGHIDEPAFAPPMPESLALAAVDTESGGLGIHRCGTALSLPLELAHLPDGAKLCDQRPANVVRRWWKRWFKGDSG